MFREELERENEHDVDQRLEKGFAKWLKNHVSFSSHLDCNTILYFYLFG